MGDQELRTLSTTHRRQLVSLLDTADSWKDLAAVIPHPREEKKLLFTVNTISILEGIKRGSHGSSSSPSDVLIEYWSTTGKKKERPTISTLVHMLRKAGLTRIADHVTCE